MTNEQSFLNISNHVQNIERYAIASDSVQWMLIGNKCDLVDDPRAAAQRGQELADKYGVRFFATSAKSGSNVLETFMTVVEDIHSRILKQPKPSPPPCSCKCMPEQCPHNHGHN